MKKGILPIAINIVENTAVAAMYFMVIVLFSMFTAVMSTCTSENDEKICVAPRAMRALMKINDKKDNIKPAFFASMKVHPFTSSGLDVVKFDDVRINRGEGYDRNTGYFTAPRKGLYQISCMILGVSGGAFHFQLNKNNVLYTYGHVDKTEYQAATITALVEMKKGDRVFIKHRVGSLEKFYGNHRSTFSGYFVYE